MADPQRDVLFYFSACSVRTSDPDVVELRRLLRLLAAERLDG